MVTGSSYVAYGEIERFLVRTKIVNFDLLMFILCVCVCVCVRVFWIADVML